MPVYECVGMIDLEEGGVLQRVFLGTRAEAAFFLQTLSLPQTPLLSSPYPSFHLFSFFLSLCFSPLRMIWMLRPNAVPACHNLWTCCHSPWIIRRPLLSNISTLHSSISPFILPFSSTVHPPSPGDLLASWLSHPSPLALALALPTLGHLSWARRGAPGPAGPCQPLQSPLCGS